MRASLLAGRGILGLAVPISAVLLLVIGLFALNAVVPIPLVERMLDIATQQSTSERIGLLTRALAQFEESPLLGSSVFEFENRVYPHNVFVEALMIGGVVGLVPLVLLLYESGRTALSCLMRASADRWLALLFLQYFIDVMFSGSLYFSAPFWSVTFAMLGLAGAGTRVGGVGRQRGPRAAAAESGAATGAPGWT
jgi:O-antigen ligase